MILLFVAGAFIPLGRPASVNAGDAEGPSAPVFGTEWPSITENAGQAGPSEVRFVATVDGLRAGFLPGGVLLMVPPAADGTVAGAVVRVAFDGASDGEPVPRGEMAHRSNYILGSDPATWRTGLRNYREVWYPDLYPGIDLRYDVSDGLKYEFLVRPGADPARIALTYEGGDGLRLDGGTLVVETSAGEIRDAAPTSFQGNDPVRCAYALRGPRTVGFACEGWDPRRTLVIDPLVYSTFIGGSSEDLAASFVRDATGAVYVTGTTISANFPTTAGAFDTTPNGARDVVVAKFDASFGLVYATYIGGSLEDFARDIRVDSSGSAFVTGMTYSSNFPVTAGAFDTGFNGIRDAFVLKLSPAGNALVYSTFLGGTDYDIGNAIEVDAAGNAYVAGGTASADFPTTVGALDTTYNGKDNFWGDAFVTKLNPTGTALVYSTFIGGTADDVAYGLDIDGPGNAYVSGYVWSANFPVTAGAFDTSYNGGGDAFALELNPTGTALVYSTFLGGTAQDWSNAVEIDAAGSAYVVGGTESTNFPTTVGAFDRTLGGVRDGHIVKLNAAGSALAYGTYLGGSSGDSMGMVAVRADGTAYVGGGSGSSDFPVTPGAYDTSTNGLEDAVLVRMNAAGNGVLYATFLGSPGNDVLHKILLGAGEDVYLLGDTSSSAFPTTAGAFDTSFNGVTDQFLSVLNLTTVQVTITTVPPGLQVTLDGISYTAPITFACDAGSSRSIGAPSPQVVGQTRYVYQSWSDGGAQTHAITCSADATYTATFATQYRVVVDSSPGGRSLLVNGVSYTAPYTFWADPGSTHALEAPSPQDVGGTRYVFQSWSDGGARAHSVMIVAPATFIASFGTSYRQRLDTIPAGLQLEVDGTPRTAPYAFYCDAGASYLVNAPSPQGIAGTRYVFRSWSDAGAQSHTVACSQSRDLTANFLTQHWTTVTTVPPGLEVQVDGTPYPAPWSSWCDEGTVHSVSVASPQVFGATRYVFTSWSDGGAQNHTVTCAAPMTLTASFGTEHSVTVDTIPVPLQVRVDGVTYTAPRTFWCPEGSAHTIETSSPQTIGATRYVFQFWSDGGAQSHPIVCGAPASYTAAFGTEYRVTVTTAPPALALSVGNASVTTPYSFWCPAGAVVTISAPSPQTFGATRYVFDAWSDGGARMHDIACDAPMTLTASFHTEHEVVLDTSPANLTVEFDGSSYPAPHRVWCVEDSSHAIGTPSPQTFGATRYVFDAWTDGGAQTHTITCTGPSSHTASFTTEHQVVVQTSPAGRAVVVDGVTLTAPQTFWWEEDSFHAVAVDSPQVVGRTRYVFLNWSDGGTQAHTIGVAAPLVLTASFATEYEIAVATQPIALQVLVGGVAQATPYAFWCRQGDSRLLEAPSPQTFGTTRYVFQTWSDGGAPSHVVACTAPLSLEAAFGTEYEIEIRTSPAGLEVRVNGTSQTAPYAFWCPAGATRTLEAPTPQLRGATRFVFQSWSDGGAASHALACGEAASITVAFETQHEVTVTTSPSGLPVVVDGTTRPSPYTFWCPEGSEHNVSAPETHFVGATRYAFARWSDGAGRSHGFSCDAPATYVAVFAAEFNWKPVVALVFAAVLASVGALLAARSGKRGRRPGRVWLLTAMPFVLLEASTGVVSLLTGLLYIPPLLGVGTLVDVAILAAGLAVAGVVARRGPADTPAEPPPPPEPT